MADESFECLICDAHLPSGTVRFYAPRDFPIAGGMYRIERIRTATDEDRELFANRPDPDDCCDKD